MNIDLSKCKPNQKVVTREGKIGIFVGCSGEVPWPYEVSFNTSIVGYTEKGYFIGPSENNRDIVAILPIEDSPGANSELLEENAKLKAEIENLRIKADAYDIACDDLEQYQQSRIASGKHPGTIRSLCDGMSWAYFTIDNLEVERGSLKAELKSVKRQLDLLLSLG